MIRIKVTRDSVCAGDDADAPHERVLDSMHQSGVVSDRATPGFSDVLSFIDRMCRGYLPSVNGNGHSWSAVLNGELIATISTTAVYPRVENITLESENHLHFRYHSATF